MLGFKVIKNKLFGGKDKEVPAAEQFYSPLRIALHSTITVGMVDWLVAFPELNKSLVVPEGSMSVLAIGTTKQARNEIYTIYMIDGAMEEFSLQLYCSPNDHGQGMELREATLYREVLNEMPQSDDEWTVALHNVGNLTFELDGLEYKRIWGGDSVSKVPLEEFSESIIRMEETLNYTNNYMLYERELVQAVHVPQKELLLVGVEESDETAQLIHAIGLTIPVSAITVQ